MNNTKPVHLRNDEYNDYIEDAKIPYVVKEGELSAEEKNLIYRCGVDYALEVDEKAGAVAFAQPKSDHNIILRIKGPFTLPESTQFASEGGPLMLKPYIIHETATTIRLKEIAEDIYKKELIKSVVPIDAEYIYEALRETAFNISMEEVVALGVGFQIIQVEFDENGHFKAMELDESHY